MHVSKNIICKVEGLEYLNLGDVDSWKRVDPEGPGNWVANALAEEDIDCKAEPHWFMTLIAGFSNLSLFPQGAILIAHYYKKKYGIHILPAEVETTVTGATHFPGLSTKTSGVFLPPSVRFWVVLFRPLPRALHWIPLLMEKKGGKVKGVILDSTGPSRVEELWKITGLLSSLSPDVKWHNRGIGRQLDNYSCGVDALVVSKDILRRKEGEISALMEGVIEGREDLLSFFARGAQREIEKYNPDALVLRGKKKGAIRLGDHFAMYKGDVVQVAKCAKSVDDKPCADPEDDIHTFRPIANAHTFLWVKAKKYEERIEKYKRILLESAEAATGGDL